MIDYSVQKRLHKSKYSNWLYMNEECCIVFALGIFFRDCCKC